MKVLELPFTLPGYDVTQNWHERYTLDPGMQWFRGLVQSVFREERQTVPKPPVVEPRKAKNAPSRRRKLAPEQRVDISGQLITGITVRGLTPGECGDSLVVS